MKNYFLLLLLLAATGKAFAQDVYYSGYQSMDGLQYACVFQNGEIINSNVSGSGNCSSNAVVLNEYTGDVYWAINLHDSFLVKKNNDLYVGSNNAYINALEVTSSTMDYFCSVGYVVQNGLKRAACWNGANGNPSFFSTSSFDSEIKGACFVSDNLKYYCGYEKTDSNTVVGKVWKDVGEEVLSIPGLDLVDLAHFDGCLYLLGNQNGHSCVWKDSESLYDLGESFRGYKIVVEGGDIFVTGVLGTRGVVWKNGSVLYEHDLGITGFLCGLCVTTDGVYYVGNSSGENGNHGVVFKNGELLYSTNGDGESFYDICVTMPESNDEIHPLPFFESFETGETDWGSWIKIDVDDDNGTRASYWDRGGTCESIYEYMPFSGDHCARHLNQFGNQEGWLISPRLFLQPNRTNTTLTFHSHNGSPGYYDYEGVYITESRNPTDLNAYRELWSASSVSSVWEEVTVDLSAYQGKAVYIAFKYRGNNAHVWSVDDVSVTEDWTPCEPITEFPFVEDFNSGTIPCWYNIDLDGSMPSWSVYYQGFIHESSNNHQTGMLITPSFSLSEGRNYLFMFTSWFSFHSDDMFSQVRISVDKTGTPDPEDFDVLWSDDFSMHMDFRPVTIDISEYAGHTVCLGFFYQGTYAHAWWISEVTLEEIIPTYDIIVESNDPAWGTVSGAGSFKHGDRCTIQARAANGYEFVKWTKGGDEVSASEDYTFTVTEDASYMAIFEEHVVQSYSLTTKAIPADGGTVIGDGTYSENSEVSVIAVPYPGYKFDHWNDDNTSNPRLVTLTEDLELMAFFSSTGVDEFAEPLLNVIPNPVKENLFIDGTNVFDMVEIYNTLGVMVRTLRLGSDLVIHVGDLAPGLYLIRCGSQTTRFVKE